MTVGVDGSAVICSRFAVGCTKLELGLVRGLLRLRSPSWLDSAISIGGIERAREDVRFLCSDFSSRLTSSNALHAARASGVGASSIGIYSLGRLSFILATTPRKPS